MHFTAFITGTDSLKREIIDRRMKGKRGRGRPRQKYLDWVMSEGYSKLKEEVPHRETWSHLGLDLPEGRELKEEKRFIVG